MAQTAQLVITCRRRLDDMTARSFTNLDVIQALDEGAKYLQGECGLLKTRVSLSLVANQREYDVPDDVQEPNIVDFFEGDTGTSVEGYSPETFRNLSRVIRRGSRPLAYTWLPTERKIVFDPVPDTAAGTTAINAGAGISATATSVTVDSTTGFPTEGRLIIDSEVMSYTNTTSTTFTGLTRGIEGTTAATHADDATVTERDIMIYGKRLYQDMEMGRRYYTTGTIAITNGLTALVGTTTSWAVNVKKGDYFSFHGTTSGNETTTLASRAYEIATVTDATNIVLADAFDEPTQTSGRYVIASPNPFPNYADGALIAHALSNLLKKAGRSQDSAMQFAIVKAFVDNANKNAARHNIVQYPQPLTNRFLRGRMPIWQGDTRQF